MVKKNISKDNELRPTVEKFSIPITDFEFSGRTTRLLNSIRVKYIGDLVQYTEKELLKMGGFGEKRLKEIVDLLNKMDLKLGITIPGWNSESLDTVFKKYVKKQKATQYYGLSKKQKATQYYGLSKKQFLTLLRSTEELDLSVRANRCLKNHKIAYIGDLVRLKSTKLLKMKNFGRTTLHELEKKLKKINLSLDMSISWWPPKDINSLVKEHSAELKQIRKQEAEKIGSKQFTPKLEDELAQLAGLVKHNRDSAIIIKLLGWSGKGVRTLESVGMEYDLSRERVRQILNKFYRKIKWRTNRKIPFHLTNLEKAVNIIESHMPNKAKIIEKKLLRLGISEKPFRVEGILRALDSIDRKAKFDIVKYNRSRFITNNKTKKAPKYTAILARKSITNMGVVTAADVAAQVSDKLKQEISVDFVNQILSSFKQFVLLDTNNSWYWHNNLARNRLLNVIKKILSVSPSINVSELRAGISRFHRMHGFAPPRRVLLALCNELPWCQVNGSIITADPPINYEEILESNEWALASVLIEEGYVLDRENLRKICLDLGMNYHTFDVYLSNSPIITRLDIGVYGLRGAKVNPGAIKALKPKRTYFKRRVLKDYGWTNDGKIWLGFKVSKGLLSGGVFSIPSAMKQFLEGRYTFKAIDGSDIGNVTIRHASGWNIRPFFDRRGGDVGDIIILEFDLSKRVVYASMGNEDLLDEYKSVET